MAGRGGRSAPAPARARSQHFLRSRVLAAELVRDAGVRSSDVVVDVGAGTGRLTAELARTARRVVAIEVDARLARRLTGRWENVEVVEGDAVSAPLPDEPFRIVANLPFDRTGELLCHLLDDPRTELVRADLVVEWGAAVKRAAVWPSTARGVSWGAWYRFAVARRLPAACFVPRPSVDAGVLRIERRERELVPTEEAGAYGAFVRAGFARGLAGVAPPRHLRRLADALAFPRGAAPRELDVHQWAALFRAVRGPSRF